MFWTPEVALFLAQYVGETILYKRRGYTTQRLCPDITAMFKDLARRLFKSTRKAERAAAQDAARVEAEKERVKRADPLDPLAALGRARLTFGGDREDPIKVTAADFPMYELVKLDESDSAVSIPVPLNASAMDAAKPKHFAMDDVTGYSGLSAGQMGGENVNSAILSWFVSQSFIGWQPCALIAQHWLVDKACTMSGDDACRNGWTLKTKTGEDLTDEQSETLKALDVEYRVMENLSEFNRFKNVFGIRVAIFEVDSDDPKYYEKPFNIDGVTKDSYKGISQVDPYWMMPMLTTASTSDPASRFFYEPEYWVISGRKYHRSHLIITRGPQPADILKPTYIFGGIPLTQRIYERVYAAERTANEAPLLSMNKRTTAIHVDLESLASNQEDFENRLAKWIKYRDNHAVKVLGTEESMEQFDTSLSDFDSIIMNQFQLVAAIAQTPATELLGTSPKGFNATGEFEMKSYHKHLVSIQTHTYTPLLDRHYLLLSKSKGIDIELTVVWNSVDTPTAAELAELNSKKAATAEQYVNMGAVSPDEVRNNLKDDDHSGFNRLTDGDANDEPGMSPENLSKLETSSAKEEQAGTPGALPGSAGAAPAQAGAPAAGAANEAPTPTDEDEAAPGSGLATSNSAVRSDLSGLMADPNVAQGLVALARLLGKLDDALTPEGVEPAGLGAGKGPGSVGRTVAPSVRSVHDVTPPMEPHKLPKMKLNGMVLAIENARGSVRRGVNLDGTHWEAKMAHHYGFIKGVTGADGDELDCFVGPNLKSDKVFVVNQNDPTTGEFDEHKCMLGFDDAATAHAGYMDSFNPGWQGFDSIWGMSLEAFRNWTECGNCCVPVNASCAGAFNCMPAMDDANNFKESEHPRKKNGQFGKGGAGGSSSSGGSGAKSGLKKDIMPKLLKDMVEAKGSVPTPEEYHQAAVEAGININPGQSIKYLKMYMKEQKAQKAGGQTPEKKEAQPEAKSEPEPKKQEAKMTSAEFATSMGHSDTSSAVAGLASSVGMSVEGTYNGKNYFKSGSNKISYDPAADTWMVSVGGDSKFGTGLQSLKEQLDATKFDAPNPAAPAKKPATPPPDEVKKYGTRLPAEKAHYTSAGIASETGMPAAIQKSIVAYKGADYAEINSAFRYNDSFDASSMSPTLMAHMLNLQRAFTMVPPSKEDANVGRKIAVKALNEMVHNAGLNSLEDLQPGAILHDPGVVSTSHAAHVWQGDVRFDIKVPKGSRAIDISETVKKHQSEQEVLLPPNSKFKVSAVNKDVSVKGGHYKYHIVCELVN